MFRERIMLTQAIPAVQQLRRVSVPMERSDFLLIEMPPLLL